MSSTQQSIEDGGSGGGIGGSGTLDRIAMFTPNGLSVGDSIIKQSPIITGSILDNTGSTDGLIIGHNISDINGLRNFGIGFSNYFSVDETGSEDVYILGGSNIIDSRLRGGIILGFANLFAGFSEGILLMGDFIFITDSVYSYIIGEQINLDNLSYSTIIGLGQNASNSTALGLFGNNNSVSDSASIYLLGLLNVVTNSTNINILGNSNVSSGIDNSNILGSNNNFAVVTDSSFVGSNDLGLLIDIDGNAGIGTLNPTSKVHIRTSDAIPTNFALKIENIANTPLVYIDNVGRVGFNQSSPQHYLHIQSPFYGGGIQVNAANSAYLNLWGAGGGNGGSITLGEEFGEQSLNIYGRIGFGGIIRVTNGFAVANFFNNVGILRAANVDTYPVWAMGSELGAIIEFNTRYVIYGQNTLSTDYILKLKDNNLLGPVDVFTARNDGHISMNQLPTSAAGLVAGELWNNGGVVNIV